MTKNEFLANWKIVIEPTTERIEIPLSSFSPFVGAVRDVADDYDISVDDIERFIERNIGAFDGMIRQRISVSSKQ